MGTTLYEGWAIVTFDDANGKPPLAGRLRYELVGALDQWSIDVPACHHHHGYSAIIDPRGVRSVTPCSEGEATVFVRMPHPPASPAYPDTRFAHSAPDPALS